jgi:arylsulfatase A-like enzyme
MSTIRVSTMARIMCWLVFGLVLYSSSHFEAFAQASPPAGRRPNVVLIMTDDQGYGDFGFHGNPVIKTPHLDRLAEESVELTRFHVSPVCSPTRSSLLTGRYNYRTGVVDTYLGRSMMAPDEVTLAETLREAGYRTAIFGKWHLGDNYPLRAMDQGFEESLVHRGGGIGQPSDPPDNHSYFDPGLVHNGQDEQAKGYVSDVITDAAIHYIEAHRKDPFFVYLAFNCPHTPLEVPDRYREPYDKADLSNRAFPQVGRPIEGKVNTADTAKIYGMVTNIDDNLGRLFKSLDELKLAEDTIVIFLTDNGPQQPRFNGGLRGRKGTVYDGGIRVPCLVRLPGRLQAGRKIDAPAAHLDLAPTLLTACGVKRPAEAKFDGVDLWPLLLGETATLPERTLFFQWHRGDAPQAFRACAARDSRFKLVQAQGSHDSEFKGDPKFELFDVVADPYEEHDLAAEKPEIVARLKREYEAWFQDVSSSRGFAPVRTEVGSGRQDRVLLSRQDWRGPRAGWGKQDVGAWELKVDRAGAYDVTVRFEPAVKAGTARLAWGDDSQTQPVAVGAGSTRFQGVTWPAGPLRLEFTVGQGEQLQGARYVEIQTLAKKVDVETGDTPPK